MAGLYVERKTPRTLMDATPLKRGKCSVRFHFRRRYEESDVPMAAAVGVGITYFLFPSGGGDDRTKCPRYQVLVPVTAMYLVPGMFFAADQNTRYAF